MFSAITSAIILAVVGVFAGRNIATLRYIQIDHQNDRVMEQEEELHEAFFATQESNMNNATGYESSQDIVHVIHTRFMQNQADLVELGFARAVLFETFCLPTMIHQTNQNFIWIIRTDPKLDPNLTSMMVDMLQPYPHFIFVKSNDNPSSFQKLPSTDHALDQSKILSGDVELARKFHKASQTSTVLESRLDADDGLRIDLVDYLQRDAHFLLHTPSLSRDTDEKKSTRKRKLRTKNRTSRPGWIIWCAREHFEWHSGSFSKGGRGEIKPRMTTICITPGLTKGYRAGVKLTDIPSTPHHKLLQNVHECKSSKDTGCVKKLKELRPSVIRARTPTSAGMADVSINLGGKNQSALLSSAEKTAVWTYTKELFRISPESVSKSNSYMAAHIQSIAAENLKGQCTKGHSCKKTSKAKLLYLAQLNTTA